MNSNLLERACRRALGGSFLAMAFAVPATFAQSQSASTGENLDEVTVYATRAVTATKTDTPILKIPQSINIVTSEQIEDRGAKTVVEALTYTAGVSSAGDDSRGDFNNIRGFESVLYLDGLKRNYGFVYLPRPDMHSLERIEVLVGPASVLYGSGSSGGLTNMQSKRAKFTPQASVSLSYGTFDRKDVAVDFNTPLSDTFAARFVGLVRDSDSQIDFVPNNRVLVQPSITWKPGDNTEITAIALYQRDENGPNYNVVPLPASIYAPPGRRLPDSRFLGEPSMNAKGHKNNASGTLLINHRFNDVFSFRSATRYAKADTDQREVYPTLFANPLNPFIDENGNGTIEPDETMVPRNLFAFDVDYKTFNSDNNVGIDFATGVVSHKVLVGVDYSKFRQDARQAFGASTPIDIYNPVYGLAPGPVYAPPTKQVLEQTGYYVQDQIDFGEVASLVLGVRRDRYTKEDTGVADEVTEETTKRAGLTVNVTSTLAPFVSYSESFLPIAGLNQFGSTYSPLTGEQMEVGVKWQPLEGTLLRLSWYEIEENNALRPDPNQPLNSIQSGYTKSKGYEFQADHNVAGDWTLTLAISKSTSNQSGEGRQRDSTPEDLASFFGTKTIPLSDEMTLRIGAGARYVGKQTSGDPAFLQVRTPSYTLVDAMAALDFNDWALKLNALNVTDKHYYPGCYWYGFCSNGLKRTLEATVEYRF